MAKVRLEKALRDSGRTVAWLARSLDPPRSRWHVYQQLCGARPILPRQAEQMARLLNWPLEMFLDGEDRDGHADA